MAINGFDGLEKMFDKMLQANEIATEAVSKAAPILEESTKKAISGALASADRKGESHSTGELVAAVICDPAKLNQYGAFSVARPHGKHSSGESNAKIANILEYGHKDGYKNKFGQEVGFQSPSPWRQKALNDAKAKCEETMRKVVEERMGCE